MTEAAGKSRRAELLEAAAGALEEYTDPFSGAFLSGHEVTFDEHLELAEDMAVGAGIVAWAVEHPKEAMAVIRAGLLGARAEAVTEALAKLLRAA